MVFWSSGWLTRFPNSLMESKQKMKNEKSIMIGINVLGLFQTTCGKSTRTWQPEKSNRESFSWFSAPVSGSRHEKGSGITVPTFLLVNLNNSWSSLANFEYLSMYAKTNWAFDRQLNFYENETKPNQDWFCFIFCNFLIHGQYLKNDNILDF